jgi:hypothetical protein
MNVSEVNEEAAKIRSTIERYAEIDLMNDGKGVKASLFGVEVWAPITGTNSNLLYINRAASIALDKLARKLAELYREIDNLFEESLAAKPLKNDDFVPPVFRS